MAKGTSLQKTTPTSQKRQRRSTEEIIERLMEAARDEFERNGYSGTKTAEIARKAGVAEALIFSNFGSKARLFQDTIFKPLDRHFNEFISTHLIEDDDAEGLIQGTQQYILELQQFIARHSKMMMSLVAAQMYGSEDVEGLNRIEGLHNYFSQAASKSTVRFAGKPKIDPKLMTRVSFASILACVLFKDWLFPKGLASREAISEAVTAFVMDGLNANAVVQVAAPLPAHSKRRRSAKGPSKAVDPAR